MVGGATVVGTLLGPEGADAFSGSRPLLVAHRRFPCGGSGLVRPVWGGGWLLVENCTVDASIFLDVNVESESVARPCAPSGCVGGFCVVLVKLLRAHGGCLGIRSR